MSWRDESQAARGRISALTELQAWMQAARPVFTGEVAARIRHMLQQAEEALRVPNSGPATSKAAAKAMTVGVGTLRHKALLAYAGAPHTDEEVGEAIGHPRIWPRCSELRAMGLIQETGDVRLCRRTGLEVAVCAITDAGRAILRANEAVA